jgi:hypothetical protein
MAEYMRLISNVIALVILSCGCTSDPRHASRTIIPALVFDRVPQDLAIAHLNDTIRKVDPATPQVLVDLTPTRILRPKELTHLTDVMTKMEPKYLSSIQIRDDAPVTLHLRNVSVTSSCYYISSIMNMQVVYRPHAILFRYGPEVAFFKVYSVSTGTVEALQSYEGWGNSPAPWCDASMMSLDEGRTILVIGSESDHEYFEENLKKTRQ